MATTIKQAQVKTVKPAQHKAPRLPHEHDESGDSQAGPPRREMQQAHDDIVSGKVDTDLHGQRGVEEVVKRERSGNQPKKTP
jgi:hypothetical protein